MFNLFTHEQRCFQFVRVQLYVNGFVNRFFFADEIPLKFATKWYYFMAFLMTTHWTYSS